MYWVTEEGSLGRGQVARNRDDGPDGSNASLQKGMIQEDGPQSIMEWREVVGIQLRRIMGPWEETVRMAQMTGLMPTEASI